MHVAYILARESGSVRREICICQKIYVCSFMGDTFSLIATMAGHDLTALDAETENEMIDVIDACDSLPTYGLVSVYRWVCNPNEGLCCSYGHG